MVSLLDLQYEYISAAVACMRASHHRMLINDMRLMGSYNYNRDVVNLEPARIIIDNEAAVFTAKCSKDTAGNQNVARRYHYV